MYKIIDCLIDQFELRLEPDFELRDDVIVCPISRSDLRVVIRVIVGLVDGGAYM
jgi:hypothetical protein